MPATGTARRLATTLTSGRRPNTSRLGTTTPTCAPSVMPERERERPERGKAFGEPRPDRADPGGRADRQPEPDRPEQQRVDEQQSGDGERQEPRPEIAPARS